MKKEAFAVFFIIAVSLMTFFKPHEIQAQQFQQHYQRLPNVKELPTIYPGKGLQEIKIGDDARIVVEKWGKEPSVNRVFVPSADGQRSIEQILMFYRKRGVSFVCEKKTLGSDKNNEILVVKCIIVKTPSFLLEKSGIHIGSSLKEIIMAYENEQGGFFPDNQGRIINYNTANPPKKIPEYLFCQYAKKGIIFTINKDDNMVVAITVVEPLKPRESFSNISGILGIGLSWNDLLYPAP